MDVTYYLEKFKKASGQLDKKSLLRKQLEVKTGIWLDSAVLKLQKKGWTNNARLFQPGPSIFFSVWINESSIREKKLLYNIHALQLRKLKGYAIASREFATAFRTEFRKFEQQWPNVSVKFGPLTLMQGWVTLTDESVQKDITELAEKFLEIDHLIDKLLDGFKMPVKTIS